MMVILIVLAFLLITWQLAKRSIAWALSWLLFMLPAYLIRMSLLGVPTTALELGIYFVFGWWIWSNRKVKFHWQPFYWLAVAWLIIGMVSVLVSADKVGSLGLWKGWLLDPILLMIVVSQTVKRSRQVDWLIDGLNYLLWMLGGVGVIQLLFNVVNTPDGRLAVFFQSPNYLAMLLVPALLMVCTKLFDQKRNWWLVSGFLVGLMALIFSASFVGIGSFLLGLIFIAWTKWMKSVNKFMLILLSGIVLISGFFYWQTGSGRLNSMIDLSQRSSVSVRLEVWRIGWEMVRQNPVWGVGLGNFEEKYLEVAPLVFHPPTEWQMLHAHNWYLHTWIEMTFFGLGCLLLIILVWWSELEKLKSKKMYWITGIMAVLLAWAVGGLFDTVNYKNDLSIIFWVLFGLTLASRKIKAKTNDQ